MKDIIAENWLSPKILLAVTRPEEDYIYTTFLYENGEHTQLCEPTRIRNEAVNAAKRYM